MDDLSHPIAHIIEADAGFSWYGLWIGERYYNVA
jgi:hypothetical protein